MSNPADDVFNSPAHLAFSNTSMRQRTQQACDKCRERKTKCSGEKPICKRCTTRGLLCQYTVRETRPRGTGHALRNSVSSIELRGEQSARLHRERQREREYYHIMHQMPYDLAPSQHYLQSQHHLMDHHRMSYSQPSSQSASPISTTLSPQQLEFSPTSSDGSFVFPEHPHYEPSLHQVRRAQSQSALSNANYHSFQSQFSESKPDAHHIHHRSLELFDVSMIPHQPAVPSHKLSETFCQPYPPNFFRPPPIPSPFSASSDTAMASGGSESMPQTPPSAPVIYKPTPSLPLLFQNVQILDLKAKEEEYEGRQW